MAQKTIYLESAFWDCFSECLNDLTQKLSGPDPADAIDRISQWDRLYKFICNSSVFVDIPLSELAEKAKQDSFLRRLLKRNGDGLIELEQINGSFPDLRSSNRFVYDDDFAAVYLTRGDYRKDAIKHGVLNISSSSIWEQNDKFIDSGDAVQKDKGWVWRNMTILKENSNGMVIIDNFVLSPDKITKKCSIREDLREILKMMLPGTCVEEYQISIFYNDNSDNDSDIARNKNQFFQSICDYIKRIRKDLVFCLELFPTWTTTNNRQKDFHDRTIITNNTWIGSEAGFDLIVRDYSQYTNTRAIKSTKTHGLYLGFGNEAALWLDKAYEQLLEDVRRCLNKYNYKTKNRLLK